MLGDVSRLTGRGVHDDVVPRFDVDPATGRFWERGLVRRIDFGRKSPIVRIEVPYTLWECRLTYPITHLTPSTYITG